jgi:hypothetical protein
MQFKDVLTSVFEDSTDMAADLVVSWFSYWLTELIYFEAIRVRLQRRG